VIAMTGRIAVRVHPGARRSVIRERLADGTLRIEVTAAPEAGRANEAVCALLAEQLGVRVRDVRVIRGLSSRSKLIEVSSLEPAQIEDRLLPHEDDHGAD
jgi:hypothetical protein